MSTADPPAHIAALLTVGDGGGLTVTVPLAAAVQPLAPVAVTVYVVVEAGLTVMLAVVAVVLHT